MGGFHFAKFAKHGRVKTVILQWWQFQFLQYVNSNCKTCIEITASICWIISLYCIQSSLPARTRLASVTLPFTSRSLRSCLSVTCSKLARSLRTLLRTICSCCASCTGSESSTMALRLATAATNVWLIRSNGCCWQCALWLRQSCTWHSRLQYFVVRQREQKFPAVLPHTLQSCFREQLKLAIGSVANLLMLGCLSASRLTETNWSEQPTRLSVSRFSSCFFWMSLLCNILMG